MNLVVWMDGWMSGGWIGVMCHLTDCVQMESGILAIIMDDSAGLRDELQPLYLIVFVSIVNGGGKGGWAELGAENVTRCVG